jgi:hypothetical protein
VFSWLKKKAAQQSLFNVEINTRTLILVSNRADASIEETGISDPGHTLINARHYAKRRRRR